MLLRRVHPSSGTLPQFWYFCLRPSALLCWAGVSLAGVSPAGVSLVQCFVQGRVELVGFAGSGCAGMGKHQKGLEACPFPAWLVSLFSKSQLSYQEIKLSLKASLDPPLALRLGRTQTSLAQVLFCCTRLCYRKQNILY